MGIFLYKVKKVEGFSAMDYVHADMRLEYNRGKENAKKNKKRFKPSLEDWGIPSSMTLEKAKVFESELREVGGAF